MKRILFLMSTSLTLIACEELNFRGQLTVHRAFTITEQYDPVECNNRVDWWNCQNKTLNVGEGVHSAEVILSQLGEDRLITLKLDGRSGQEVKIKGNKNVNLGDRFYVNAADINQNFDIKGTIATKVSNSEEQWGSEGCSETHYEQQCHWERDPRDRRDRWVCQNVPVTYYGDREVRFYYKTTVKDLVGQFIRGKDLLADVSGTYTNTEQIYTYRSACHLRSRY